MRRADRSGLAAYREVFFTDKGAILKRLATKAATEAMPDIEDVLRTEAERLAAVLDRIAGAALVERTRGAAAARPRHRRALRRAPSGGAPRSTTTT